MHITPITLTGRHIRLEPLAEAHVPDLCLVGLEPSLFSTCVYGEIDSEARMLNSSGICSAGRLQGADLPFAVIDRPLGHAIGCARASWISSRETGGAKKRWDLVRAGLPAHSGKHGKQSLLLTSPVRRPGDASGFSSRPTCATNARSTPSNGSAGCRKDIRNHMIPPTARPRFGLYQHHRPRMAGGKSTAGGDADPKIKRR